MNNPFNLPNNGMFNPNNPVILGGMAGTCWTTCLNHTT